MKIRIWLNKPVIETAQEYYEKAKKLREKLKRALEQKELTLKELDELKKKRKIKREWFMKYRFTFTENGFLVIGGKDANQNERIIRHYKKDGDLVFHTELPGSPFALLMLNNPNAESVEEVIKNFNLSENDLKQAAGLAAVYSKAWKEGFGEVEVFYVLGKQVSKKAPSGEYLKHGSFMIYGKKNYIRVPLKLYIVEKNNLVYALPSELGNHKGKYIELIPGNLPKEKVAKKISEFFEVDEEYIKSILPSGGFRIINEKS